MKCETITLFWCFFVFLKNLAFKFMLFINKYIDKWQQVAFLAYAWVLTFVSVSCMHTYKIHPSKLVKVQQPHTIERSECITDESTENSIENSESDTSQCLVDKKLKMFAVLAVKLRTSANLSLSQTVKVLRVLHETFSDDRFLPPTRSAINKASNNAEIEGVD